MTTLNHYSKKFFRGIIPTAAVLTLLPLAATAPASYAEETSAGLNSDPVVERAISDLNCKNGESKQVQGQDGLTHKVGCFEMGKAESSLTQEVTPTNHWNPYLSKTLYCGSSYVRNQEIAYLLYRGTVYASGEWATGGDCGGTGRVYRASIAYKRGGKTLNSATVTAGHTKTITAWDDPIDSFGPPTEFHYNFVIGP